MSASATQQLTQLQKVRMLYKAILKLHRGLPPELKIVGDDYARNEFKRHKTCNQVEAKIFMTEWMEYALTLANQLGLRGPKFSKPLGSTFSEDDLDKFREDQLHQLYDLMLAATGKKEEEKSEEQEKK